MNKLIKKNLVDKKCWWWMSSSVSACNDKICSVLHQGCVNNFIINVSCPVNLVFEI